MTVGQVLARMDTTQLHAQLRQAEAQWRRAIISVDTAKSLVAQREAERKSATAVIAQRSAELDTADRKLQRSEQLIRTNAVPQQVLDDDRAAAEGAKAAVAQRQCWAPFQSPLATVGLRIVDIPCRGSTTSCWIGSIYPLVCRRVRLERLLPFC